MILESIFSYLEMLPSKTLAAINEFSNEIAPDKNQMQNK
jgi:hypothetical protein